MGSLPKKPKDEKCPKRPLSSYFLYAKDVRQATKEEFPEMKITDIAKEISKKWKLLSEEEKKPFADEANSLKEKYNKDMEEYKGSEAETEYKKKLAEWQVKCDARKADAKEKKKKKKTPTKGKKSKRRMVESSSEDESDSSSGSYESDSDSDSSSGSDSSS